MAFLRQLSSCKSSLAKESLSLSFTHSVLEEGIGLRLLEVFRCSAGKNHFYLLCKDILRLKDDFNMSTT